jgi:hypothetical protein
MLTAFAADGGIPGIHQMLDAVLIVGPDAFQNIEELIFAFMGMQSDAAAWFQNQFGEHSDLLGPHFLRGKNTLQLRDPGAALEILMPCDFKFGCSFDHDAMRLLKVFCAMGLTDSVRLSTVFNAL